MKGDPIPDPDHVARYCGGSQIRTDGKVSGMAFRLKPREEYVSINWLEQLDRTSRSIQIDLLRPILARSLRIGAKARIAVLNVGEVKRAVRSESPDAREIDFRHEPLEGDPSHGGIFGLDQEDDLIGDLIASRVCATFPAKGPRGVES